MNHCFSNIKFLFRDGNWKISKDTHELGTKLIKRTNVTSLHSLTLILSDKPLISVYIDVH